MAVDLGGGTVVSVEQTTTQNNAPGSNNLLEGGTVVSVVQGTAPNIPPKNNPPGGSGGSTGSGNLSACQKVTNGEHFCDHKFKDSFVLKDDKATIVKKWEECQDRCWDAGSKCQGWHVKLKTGECWMASSRKKSDMAYATGFMGGPRWDVSAGSGGGGDSSSPSTNNSNSSSSDTSSSSSSGSSKKSISDLLNDKPMVISSVAGFLIAVSFSMMMMMMVATMNSGPRY